MGHQHAIYPSCAECACLLLTGRWKGTNAAVKILNHGAAGQVSNMAVAREKMIGLASAHPNVVSNPPPVACPVTAWHAISQAQGLLYKTSCS